MYLSILYFITGLLGFMTFSVVVAQYRSNRKVNIYLIILLFYVASRFLLGGIHILISFDEWEDFMIVFRSFGSFVFPCMYLYFTNLVIDEKYFIKADLRHFIFPVVLGFANLLIRKYAISLHFYIYFLFSGIALYYLFLSYVELKNKVWFRKPGAGIVDSQKALIRNWTIFIFILYALSILRIVISIFLDIYIAGYSDGTNYFWISAVLCCVLFFKILLTPVVLHFTNATNDNGQKKEHKKENFVLVFDDFWILSEAVLVLNDQDLKLKERVNANLLIYVHDIERMALEQFCFRNPVISMRDFAIKLGIPRSHLIYLFKCHSNVSFIEFKKTVRIYDAINLIEAGFLKSNALMCLCKKTGFSTYDLFLTSFKEITGVSPQEYNKMIEE